MHLLDDGGAAFEHLDMEIELEAFEMTPLARLVVASEFGFFGAPFFQGLGGDAELCSGEGEIAIELVDFVEGVDFGVEGVAAFHGALLSGWGQE